MRVDIATGLEQGLVDDCHLITDLDSADSSVSPYISMMQLVCNTAPSVMTFFEALKRCQPQREAQP